MLQLLSYAAGFDASSIRVESNPQEAVDLLVAEHEKHPDNPYMFPSPVTGGMYYPDAVNAIDKVE